MPSQADSSLELYCEHEATSFCGNRVQNRPQWSLTQSIDACFKGCSRRPMTIVEKQFCCHLEDSSHEKRSRKIRQWRPAWRRNFFLFLILSTRQLWRSWWCGDFDTTNIINLMTYICTWHAHASIYDRPTHIERVGVRQSRRSVRYNFGRISFMIGIVDEHVKDLRYYTPFL